MQHSRAHCVLLSVGAVFFTSFLAKTVAQQEYEEPNKALQLEALKASILEYLGMESPPGPGEKASHRDLVRMFHQYRRIKQLFRGNSTQEDKLQQKQRASTVLFPSTVEPLNSTTELKQQWFRVAFNKNSTINNGLTLKQARLHIQRPHRDKISPNQSWLTKDILVRTQKPSGFHTEAIFHTKDLNKRHLKLDLTHVVKRWLRDTNAELLVVEICLIRKRKARAQSKPRLSLELNQSSRRVRRGVTADEDESLCRRRSLNVSFKDIGWSDWIIAPSGYTMHYCDGSCPHNYKPASMHTQVKSRLYLMSKGSSRQPCCVPASYEPMVLMHYDSRGKLKLTPFNDLIVSECHCA